MREPRTLCNMTRRESFYQVTMEVLMVIGLVEVDERCLVGRPQRIGAKPVSEKTL